MWLLPSQNPIALFAGSSSRETVAPFFAPLFPSLNLIFVKLQVYNNYPEDLGAALYREPFDFNAEPPWDPS